MQLGGAWHASFWGCLLMLRTMHRQHRHGFYGWQGQVVVVVVWGGGGCFSATAGVWSAQQEGLFIASLTAVNLHTKPCVYKAACLLGGSVQLHMLTEGVHASDVCCCVGSQRKQQAHSWGMHANCSRNWFDPSLFFPVYALV